MSSGPQTPQDPNILGKVIEAVGHLPSNLENPLKGGFSFNTIFKLMTFVQQVWPMIEIALQLVQQNQLRKAAGFMPLTAADLTIQIAAPTDAQKADFSDLGIKSEPPTAGQTTKPPAPPVQR